MGDMFSNKSLLIGIGILAFLGFFIWAGATNKISFRARPQEVIDKNAMAHNVTIKSEEEFIKNMIPHHEEAITASQDLLATTTDPELQKFAQGVITVQQQEVATLKEWYKTWFGKEYTPDSSYQSMMKDISTLPPAGQDIAYIEGMIDHHNGAIDMAQQVKPIATRDELKTLADAIISTQSKEVTYLKSLQNAKQAPAGEEMMKDFVPH